MVSSPIVIERIGETETKWFLSFNGHDPNENDSIELTSEQCFWLLDKIMNIAPNFLHKTKEICLHSKL